MHIRISILNNLECSNLHSIFIMIIINYIAYIKLLHIIALLSKTSITFSFRVIGKEFRKFPNAIYVLSGYRSFEFDNNFIIIHTYNKVRYFTRCEWNTKSQFNFTIFVPYILYIFTLENHFTPDRIFKSAICWTAYIQYFILYICTRMTAFI